jgi:C4-dicarboxylate transporter
MKRLARLAVISFLVTVLAGCGAVFVGFVSNPGVVPTTMSGTVLIVFLGISADANGTVAQVTQVTLETSGVAKSMAFCGDQRTLFPINQSIKVEFTNGTPCSALVNVAII